MEPLLVESPIGLLVGAAEGKTLTELRFFDGAAPQGAATNHPVAELLTRYFEGDLEALAAIEYQGAGTDFQTQVWAQVAHIPVGETASYKDIAERIGRPKSTRAVGAANGKNPVGLVVPCHRVIGSSGQLTGYAWGLWRKRWLLVHEGARVSYPADLLGPSAREPRPDQVVV